MLHQAAGHPLSVVYLDFEMTEGDLYERLAGTEYGPKSDLSNLHCYLLPSLPLLDTAEGGAALVAIAAEHEADLIIMDSTSRVLEGAGNDADTMRASTTTRGCH